MQPQAMGPTYPTVPAPPAPLETIGHQAAGIELGCATCGQEPSLGEVKAMPTWAKFLMGGGILTVLLGVTYAIAKR
jgi:hypothetical protein